MIAWPFMYCPNTLIAEAQLLLILVLSLTIVGACQPTMFGNLASQTTRLHLPSRTD
jgi:hypothetical protein